MKERLYKFMYGRYGNDSLNRFLLVLTIVFWVLSLFTTNYFYIIGVLLLVLMYFRMLSKNIYKRADENKVYLKYEYKVKGFFGRIKRDMKQRRTHHIYKCPSCKQKIRIPRGKGKIEVTCPKCSNTFVKKS